MNRQFDRNSTCDQVLEGIDLSGKTAIVTGASGGLGAEAARALAAAGAQVTLAARNMEKTALVADSIREAHPNANIDVGQLELVESASVKAFAQNWREQHGQLDLLLLNAGIMACPLMRTSEGWEMQLATNHFGHFLLSSELLAPLKASGDARVVALSSGGHVISPVLLDDPHFENSDYDPWIAYGQAKTANIWFTNELERRFGDQGIHANAVHPGVIFTDLSRHLTEESLTALGEQLSGIEPKSAQAGAATGVYASTAPELQGKGGLYLSDCQVVTEDSDPSQQFAPHAFNPEGEAALWALTEEALSIEFGTPS